MKKQTKWSYVGYIGGIVFILTAIYRYLQVIPDYDRAIVYSIVGILICCVSWLYNKTKSIEYTLSAVEEYLADQSETQDT